MSVLLDLYGCCVKGMRPAGGLCLAQTTYQDGPVSLPVQVPVWFTVLLVWETTSGTYVQQAAGMPTAARLSTSRAEPVSPVFLAATPTTSPET